MAESCSRGSGPEPARAFFPIRALSKAAYSVVRSWRGSTLGLYGSQPTMEICWEPAGLPEAIWAQAARHLSIKEYARMAGTCKIFSELAPTVDVCIDEELTEDGTATPGGSILVCIQ